MILGTATSQCELSRIAESRIAEAIQVITSRAIAFISKKKTSHHPSARSANVHDFNLLKKTSQEYNRTPDCEAIELLLVYLALNAFYSTFSKLSDIFT